MNVIIKTKSKMVKEDRCVLSLIVKDLDKNKAMMITKRNSDHEYIIVNSIVQASYMYETKLYTILSNRPNMFFPYTCDIDNIDSAVIEIGRLHKDEYRFVDLNNLIMEITEV